MSPFRRDAVRVLVPASSANLGPAFDSAGLALDLVDELVGMVSDDEGVLVEVVGEGCDAVSRDESHLVVRAMAAAFDWLGEHPPGFVLRCTNVIPHGRGLGSSAAAVIGGIVLARAMVADGPSRMTDADVLQVALAFESHPDNLSAALYGGFTVAWLEDDGLADAVRLDPHTDLRVVALVPPDELLTSRARAMLPEQVSLSDAVVNVSRAALLVHAVTTDPRRLMSATNDRLHQAQRAEAFPASWRMVTTLREHGIPAVISGAGPTVLAFPPAGADDVVTHVAGDRWTVLRLPVARHGAREVPIAPLG